MRINTNTAAMNTYSNLTSANASKSGSLAKLSSGLRINKAGDDAAGLAISEKMKNQISGMTQASRNAQDGISLIQTAEGALSETHSILNRMRDLTVQASNDTNTLDDRSAIQKEINSLSDEVNRIADTTKFNGKDLMNANGPVDPTKLSTALSGEGTGAINNTKLADAYNAIKDLTTGETGFASDATAVDQVKGLSKDDAIKVVNKYNEIADTATEKTINVDNVKEAYESKGSTNFKFQIGANAGEKISVTINNMTTTGLDLTKDNLKVDYTDEAITAAGKDNDPFEKNLVALDKAIASVSTERANLGATQNRLDHTVSNLATTKENLSEANSRITDVDMAEEMMSFTKSNILSQASTSMLAQANQMPQSVLSLLQ
ncbi:flagellin [Desemzia incerta]|uniref:flagellin N-terminal helical domain-containing protein n=1 Tax=Desemzia incerta TaxID=82801 RepID=UPI0024C2EF48|nr:flagellin [Desemzia incerta]WHZ32353.1 flagellin [Desemzia incerta]